LQSFKRQARRFLPGRAATDGGHSRREVTNCFLEQHIIVGMDGNHHAADHWVVQKSFKRPNNHRSAADPSILLGTLNLTGSFATAGGKDNDGDI
jgi:hypothetical protein